MTKILLAEDDPKLAKLIAEYLANHGFTITIESRGDQAIYRILNENYQLVILDINLPVIDGLQICKIVRKNFYGFIVMLTASSADEDQITGFEHGVDDYINKPINPEVLLSRINATLRRDLKNSQQLKKLTFGKLHIKLESRIVSLDNKLIDLTPKEFDLLVLLAVNAGTSLSRNNIMHATRGIDYDGIDRSIDLRISHLRSKLNDDIENPFRIITVRSKGYSFQPDEWD